MDVQNSVGFGFVDLRSHFGVRINDIQNGQVIVGEAMDLTLLQYSREFYNRMQGLFVTRTTRAKERFVMPGGKKLQRIDPQHGIPRPTYQYKGYDIGTTIEGLGDAMGDNRVSRRLISVGEANRLVQEITQADYNSTIDLMLAAMLVKESYKFEDETRLGWIGAGIIDVVPLANGDEATYIKSRGRSVGTDNHYMPIEGRISTTNDPFVAIKRNLTEHGSDPDARVIVYVADNLASDIQDMGHFVARTRIDEVPGSNTAQVSNAPDRGIGDDVLGMVSGCWIVQASAIPSGYMLAHLTGRKPLSMREYPSADLQGLFREEASVNGNHMEVRFIRIAGFSGRDRTAALAAQVGVAAGAAYTSPPVLAAELPAPAA